MKKETKKVEHSDYKDNSFGVASVILGILSIVFASVNGIVFGIIGLVFANKQQKKHSTNWARNGKTLSIIGIILSIITIVIILFYPSLLQNLTNANY